MSLPENLNKKLQERGLTNTLRKLNVRNSYIDFSSNDYLGFARSEEIYAKTIAFLENKKLKENGATGSRLLTGNHNLFKEAEEKIAHFHNSEAALIYNSGYNANLGLLSSVTQRGDIIFYDEYCHASLRDGIQLSNAKSIKYLHNDMNDLKVKLERIAQSNSNIYIVTESIFSMDGDSPDFTELIGLTKVHNALLIVDEAHATGIFGNSGSGLLNELGIEQEVFATIHTFGKAMGCHGAVILGSKKLIQYLYNFSRPFIYTTALSPHSIANIIMAYDMLTTTPAITELKKNISYFKSQIKINNLENKFVQSHSQIQCCIVDSSEKAKEVSRKLLNSGFDVKAILYPTVPMEKERLRFCLHSYSKPNEIQEVLKLLSNYIND